MSEKETRFVIDGDIEGSSAEKNAQTTGVSSGALIFFIVLSLLFLSYIIYLQFRIHHLNDRNGNKVSEEQTDSLYTALIEQSKKLDSLELVNLKLKQSNDLLLENAFHQSEQGIYYEVQIGSFKDFNLDKYQEELAALKQEKVDGKTKLLLGRFRSFKKALLFENDMKRLGLKGAFIIGRIDGTIVGYQEALAEQKRREGTSP
jgi:hypothetical protein